MAQLLRALSRTWYISAVSNKETVLYRHSFHCCQKRQIQLATGHPYTDYEHERKTVNLTVPEYFNFAADFMDQWAKAEQTGLRGTNNPAFWWVDGASKKEIKWSFQQLSQLSQRVANALTGGCGLQKGDIVIVILPRVPEWWLLSLACIRAGLILSSGTVMLRANDIRHRLQLSGAKCIITHSDLVPAVEEATADGSELPLQTKILVGPRSETRSGWLNYDALVEKASEGFQTVHTKASDPMSLFFTSGTTGSPKMAEHSHASYGLGHTLTARYFIMNTSHSIVWNISDTGWAKCAWSSFFAPWIHGSCIFIYNAATFDPAETLKVLKNYPVDILCSPPTANRHLVMQSSKEFQSMALKHCICGGEPVVLGTFPVTHFCSSPTGIRLLVLEPSQNFKFPALHHCMTAGEPTNPELIEIWKRDSGLDIHEGYGQTETTLICSRPPCIEYKPSSMGKASPGIDVAIVDDDGNVQEPGKEGNIAVKVKPHRPVSLFTHYLNEPERTAASYVGDYYLMGDRAYMDEEGYVFFVGRGDDVIISSGYRIGPFEVESALLEHPCVVESAVVSSPDSARGEVVKAFVILKPEYVDSDKEQLTQDLQNHVKSITAPYKYPRKVEFVSELPKTISGKIRRVELRNKEWERK